MKSKNKFAKTRLIVLTLCLVLAAVCLVGVWTSVGAETGIAEAASIRRDGYGSADEAAYGWAQEYAATSIKENREYGSTIYQTSNGRYAYTVANRGSSNSCTPSKPSGNVKKVALIHSHGKAEWSKGEEFFSGNDYSYTLDCGLDTIYVTTPEGKLKRGNAYGESYHNSWWGNAFAAFTTPWTTKTVRSDLQHDRKASGQAIQYKHWFGKHCSKCAN